MTARRTKRRYAHELYPHAQYGETRPLAAEVPYLYARAQGLQVWGTGWFDMREGDSGRLAMERTNLLVQTRHLALVADALLQGMAGDEAWTWADERAWDESGEWAGERALHYGVPLDQIKPYPCGPEPDHHDHHGKPMPPWGREIIRVDGKESECSECTEEIPAATTEAKP